MYKMPFIFIVILALYLGGNIYIFIKGMHAFSYLPSLVGIPLAVIFWLCVGSFAGFFLFRNATLPALPALVMQNVSTGWLVFSLYMIIQLLFLDLLKLFRIYPPYGFQIALGITCCLLLYGFYHYKHPKKEVVNIVFNKSLTGNQPLKIVGISDIHLGYATNKQQLKKYVNKVMAERPDLILIAGDLIDNSVIPLNVQKMEEELRKLSAPLGVYMIPGNHEYISGIQPAIEFISKTPIQLLRDSVVVLPNGIQIIGRDDRMNPTRKSLKELTVEINYDFPVILLDHQPYELEKTVSAGVDLQLSGHTHRGQVWPFNWLTDGLFEISYGYEQKGNTHFYVSSGLSLWGPPFRIGTHSEWVVFELTGKE